MIKLILAILIEHLHRRVYDKNIFDGFDNWLYNQIAWKIRWRNILYDYKKRIKRYTDTRLFYPINHKR